MCDEKINQIETEGLMWNIGSNYCVDTLKWGTMISTSNSLNGLGKDEDWSCKVKSYGIPLVFSTTLKWSKSKDHNENE